ncbi:MAG: pantoate--beta-alanine ligase [Chloroflexi bacterium]|nr:pantoate--beta-alanine ligase [Chloroflexota bacterium]
MRVVETVADLRRLLAGAPRPVGFVPTMGYLHQGHMSLVARARSESATVVLSIFVNPTQFGPNEDLDRYPRDVPRDLRMSDEGGVDVVFAPGASEVYPRQHRTFVEVKGLQDRWEGASRPEHFRGVATVVTLLFRMLQPDRAYFGEKDYQQLQIVRRLTEDLRLDVEIVGCPTIREPDGLACSSRNVYLRPDERQRAPALHRALESAQKALHAGVRRGTMLRDVMTSVIEQTSGATLDYAAVVDPETLEPVESVDHEARALIAVHLGNLHLIDNAPLIPPHK